MLLEVACCGILLNLEQCLTDQRPEPPPLLFSTPDQKQRCVMSWLLNWGTTQRKHFLQDLFGKAVPGKVCTLLELLSTLQVKDSPANIFECQRLPGLTVIVNKNLFLTDLPSVAETAGRDRGIREKRVQYG
uniref:Uncharacterized protein n=1 Tax=Oncorhynchus kisutch TaxID=8019 RepID=A0A8C7NBA2_ONCKI